MEGFQTESVFVKPMSMSLCRNHFLDKVFILLNNFFSLGGFFINLYLYLKLQISPLRKEVLEWKSFYAALGEIEVLASMLKIQQKKTNKTKQKLWLLKLKAMGRNLYGTSHSIVKELKWPTHLSCFADGKKVGATHLARESIPWENTWVRHTSQPG